MNVFKKLIAALIILSVSVSILVHGADSNVVDYSSSIKFLVSADILQNHTVDDAHNQISRIEFAKIIARIVFPDDNYYWSTERKYSDVVAEYKEILSLIHI